MDLIIAWFRRHFSDPQAVILAVLLGIGFAVIIFFGHMLAPVLASIVIAYLLEGLVGILQRQRVPRLLAVLLVYSAFMTYVVFVLIGLMPLLTRQLSQLFQQLPTMIERGQTLLMQLPERYPSLITAQQVSDIINSLRTDIGQAGQQVLSYSLTSVLNVITVLVYLVVMPLLVFFFLKDKQRIIAWFTGFLPRERGLATQVWSDVDQQIANYVRGKFVEILIVWAASYLTFALMGLNFAMLLGVLMGLSVIIPYIGAVVVTVPVALIAYFQWGWGSEFAYLMLAYTIIHAIDGNLLVPLLFSEVVNLHPIAIIVAVLVFGGLWGFWGVFFAIPLATLVQAVLKAWPKENPAV
jgi:putative permease